MSSTSTRPRSSVSASIPTTTILDRLDVATIKADFPILNQVEAGRELLAFLDSAASSQKPQAVIDALSGYSETTNANIHRGVYRLSERATARYEEARHLVADFIGAADPARAWQKSPRAWFATYSMPMRRAIPTWRSK